MKGTVKQVEVANRVIDKILDCSDVKSDRKAELARMLIEKKPDAAFWIELNERYSIDPKNVYQNQIYLSSIIKGDI